MACRGLEAMCGASGTSRQCWMTSSLLIRPVSTVNSNAAAGSLLSGQLSSRTPAVFRSASGMLHFGSTGMYGRSVFMAWSRRNLVKHSLVSAVTALILFSTLSCASSSDAKPLTKKEIIGTWHGSHHDSLTFDSAGSVVVYTNFPMQMYFPELFAAPQSGEGRWTVVHSRLARGSTCKRRFCANVQ